MVRLSSSQWTVKSSSFYIEEWQFIFMAIWQKIAKGLKIKWFRNGVIPKGAFQFTHTHFISETFLPIDLFCFLPQSTRRPGCNYIMGKRKHYPASVSKHVLPYTGTRGIPVTHNGISHQSDISQQKVLDILLYLLQSIFHCFITYFHVQVRVKSI